MALLLVLKVAIDNGERPFSKADWGKTTATAPLPSIPA
jgi:hypothetical protein